MCLPSSLLWVLVLGVLALFFYNINEEKIIENSAKLAELKKGK